jgi:hypothetical protein
MLINSATTRNAIIRGNTGAGVNSYIIEELRLKNILGKMNKREPKIVNKLILKTKCNNKATIEMTGKRKNLLQLIINLVSQWAHMCLNTFVQVNLNDIRFKSK